jgi:hypothetical protein
MANGIEPMTAHQAAVAVRRARTVAAHGVAGVVETRRALQGYLAEQRKGWRLPDLKETIREKVTYVSDLDRAETALRESKDPIQAEFDIDGLRVAAKRGLHVACEAALPALVETASREFSGAVMSIRQSARDALATLEKLEALLTDVKAVAGQKIEGPRVIAPKPLIAGLKAVAAFTPEAVTVGEA